MNCKKCGRPLPDDAKFCGVCGTPVSFSAEPFGVGATPQPEKQPPKTPQEDTSGGTGAIAPEYRRPTTAPGTSSYSYYSDRNLGNDFNEAPVLSVGQFFLQDLLCFIPVVNIILVIFWSFAEDVNPNRRNWARSRLIWVGIGLAVSIFGMLLMLSAEVW